MAEFRGIIVSSLLMLVFGFTATGQQSYFTVRPGDEVTLSCDVINDHDQCNSATWLYSEPDTTTVTLFEHGQIHRDAKAKSDRLSVTEDCSLVIKDVTGEDVGYYTCRQLKAGQKHSWVYLSVVNMTKHQENDNLSLHCSVGKPGRCFHTVNWMYEGKIVLEDNKDMEISRSECSVTVTFLTSYLQQQSKYYELFKCKVTNINTGKEHLFTFSPPQSSGEKPGGWWLIVVLVGVAALIIITVAVIGWKRTRGNRTQTDDNKADPEDGVSYASISYTKKTNSKAQVHVHDDDDEGDAVTYSTVKAPSSSAGASAGPSELYATVNKPNK